MRLLETTELMRLTRSELCDLFRWITSMLSDQPAGSIERLNALRPLENIRRVLLQRDWSP
jgi:hypothetical protein